MAICRGPETAPGPDTLFRCGPGRNNRLASLAYLIGLSGFAGAMILYCLLEHLFVVRTPISLLATFSLYGHSLTDVVNLTLHLPDLGALGASICLEVVGESVKIW